MARTQIKGVQIKDEDITNADIKDGTVRGTSANTAGILGEIQQGTISTPDLRDAAVSPAKIDNTATYSMAVLQLGNGTSAAPSLAFTSDTGTGLYRVGSGDIAFSLSGTKNLELTSSQLSIAPATLEFGSSVGSVGTAIIQPLTASVAGSLRFTTTVSNGGDGFWSFNNKSGTSTTWIQSSNGSVGINTPPAQFATALTVTGGGTFYGGSLTFLSAFTAPTTTITPTYPVSSVIYTLPDAGSNANIVLDKGSYTIAGAWSFSSSSGVDFLQHQAKQLVVHLLASDPGSPVEGQIWYNTTTHQWSGYNGTSNVLLG